MTQEVNRKLTWDNLVPWCHKKKCLQLIIEFCSYDAVFDTIYNSDL